MSGLTIPISNISNKNDFLSVGTYKLVYKNAVPEIMEPENKTLKQYDNSSLDFSYLTLGMSDKIVTLKSARYNKKRAELSLIISISENPIPLMAIGVTAGAVLGIGGLVLTFIYGKQVIFIPSLAIIAGSVAYISSKF